ncbi:Calnexin, partial [Operophtera brumata]
NMAPFRSKVLFGCLLVLVSAAVLVKAEEAVDEATVEVEEEVEEYTSPEIPKRVYFAEHFDDSKAFGKKWVKSEAKKQGVDEDIAKYDGKWELKTPARKIFKDDLGLVLTTEAKHAAISALLDKPFEFKDKPLFHDQTAYTIMFGPDKCGNDNKLHFIFRHKNPKNGTIEEKHSKKPTVLVDSKEVNSGSLLEDFTPAIVDPTAQKPEDWDEEAPAQIIDPNAAPLIDNPLCATAPGCGPWSPPTIPNPNFKLLFDNLIVTDDELIAELWAAQTYTLKRAKMSRDSDPIGESKKVDAVAEDDPHESEPESDSRASDAEAEPQDSPKARSKADLEGPSAETQTESDSAEVSRSLGQILLVMIV